MLTNLVVVSVFLTIWYISLKFRANTSKMHFKKNVIAEITKFLAYMMVISLPTLFLIDSCGMIENFFGASNLVFINIGCESSARYKVEWINRVFLFSSLILTHLILIKVRNGEGGEKV